MKNKFNSFLLCCIFIFLILGCDSPKKDSLNSTAISASKPGTCAAVEVSKNIPDGGSLADTVTISRDSSGSLETKWKTQFPLGTKASITVGLWKPNPKKDISHGPILDSLGMDNLASDGNFIDGKFSNDGKGFNEGQYYLELTVIDNPIWNQPSPAASLLAASKGKIKSVKGKTNTTLEGISFEVFTRFELPKCDELQTTAFTPPTMPGKQNIEGVARKILVKKMESQMAQSGHPATLTVSDEDSTVLTAESAEFTGASVAALANNSNYLASFRKMGFKQIIFTDGSEKWKVEVK